MSEKNKKPVSKEVLQKIALALVRAQLEHDREVPRILETLELENLLQLQHSRLLEI